MYSSALSFVVSRWRGSSVISMSSTRISFFLHELYCFLSVRLAFVPIPKLSALVVFVLSLSWYGLPRNVSWSDDLNLRFWAVDSWIDCKSCGNMGTTWGLLSTDWSYIDSIDYERDKEFWTLLFNPLIRRSLVSSEVSLELSSIFKFFSLIFIADWIFMLREGTYLAPNFLSFFSEVSKFFCVWVLRRLKLTVDWCFFYGVS